MLRPVRSKLLLSVLAACSSAAVASAQLTPAPATPAEKTPVAKRADAEPNPLIAPTPAKTDAKPAATTPSSSEANMAPRTRAVSPAVAAQLRAAAASPQFAPKPEPPKPAVNPVLEQVEVDARDIDKPRNGIVRLPTYVVLEKKPQILSERAVNTDKGLTEIAMRRHISETDYVMNRFYIPVLGTSVQNRALAMYAEQERLNNISSLSDTAIAANMDDRAQGAYIRKEAQKATVRQEDFGWNNGNNTDRK